MACLVVWGVRARWGVGVMEVFVVRLGVMLEVFLLLLLLVQALMMMVGLRDLPMNVQLRVIVIQGLAGRGRLRGFLLGLLLLLLMLLQGLLLLGLLLLGLRLTVLRLRLWRFLMRRRQGCMKANPTNGVHLWFQEG